MREELVNNVVNAVSKAMEKGAKRQGYWVDPLIKLCNDVLAEHTEFVIYLKGNGKVMIGLQTEVDMNGVFGRKKPNG